MEAILPFEMRSSLEQLHGGDREHQEAVLLAKEALAELKEFMEGEEWQPIDSAPKNKRFLIAGYHKNRFNGKKYSRTEIAFHTEGNRIEFNDYDEHYPDCYNSETEESYLPEGLWLDAYSYDGYSDNLYFKVDWVVTHWMPLPKNPSSNQRD